MVRWRKWVLGTAAAAALAVPASGGILSGFKNSLISFALDQISVPDTMEIAAETIEDPDDGFVRLGGVTIADKNGVWMSIESLQVSWNVSRILKGELDIRELSATNVRVERAPNPEDVEVEVKEGSELDSSLGGIFDWPRSPIDTKIERMALDGVYIAEGVMAEQSLAFTAEGSARDEGNIQALDLEVSRTDETEGRIDVDYSRDFDANTLTLLLTAREDPGGIVTEVFGLPNDAASTVTVDADGPLTDWSLEFAAQTTDIYQATGSAVVSTGSPFTTKAEFTIIPGPNMSETTRNLLAPKASLVLDLSEDEDAVIAIREGSFTSPHVNLDATGAYDQRAGVVDMDLTLAAEGGVAAGVEGVALERVTFDGRIEGPTDDLEASGALRLVGLATAPLDIDTAELRTTVTITPESVGAALQGQIDGVRIDRLSREQVGKAEINGTVAYSDPLIRLDGFTISSPLIGLGASGEINLSENIAGLAYRVSAPELGPVARTYEVNADGSLSIEGQLAGSLDAPELKGNATLGELVFQGTPYGQVTLQHDINLGAEPQGTIDLTASGSPAGPAEIDTAFVLTEDQELRLTEMTAKALGITAEGRATVNLETTLTAGDLNIDATDLTKLGEFIDQPISGGGTGRVALTIEGGRQLVDARIEVADLSSPGIVVGSGQLTADVDDALGTPALDIRLTGGSLEGGGVAVDRAEGSFVSRDGGRVADVAFNLVGIDGDGFAAPSARLAGTVTEPFGDVAMDLGLSIAEVTGETVETGSISGSIVGQPRLERVDVDVAIDGFAASGATGERVVLDTVIRDALDEAAVKADLLVGGLAYDGRSLGQLTATVETTAALETVRASADLSGGTMIRAMTFAGLVTNPAAAAPGIDADITLEALDYDDIRVSRFRGTVDSTEAGAVVLDVIVDDFAAAGATGERAVIEGRVADAFSSRPQPDVDLNVTGLTYDGVRLGTLTGSLETRENQVIAYDLDLSGVDGQGLTVQTAAITGTVADVAGTPEVNADLDVRDLTFRDIRLNALTGTVRTAETDGRLELDLVLAELASQGVRVRRATIDGVVAEPFSPTPRPTVDLTVTGLGYRGDTIGDLTARVAASESGDQIDLDLSLDAANPQTRANVDATVIDPYGQPLVDARLDIARFALGNLFTIGEAEGTIETSEDGQTVDLDLTLGGIRGFGASLGFADIDGVLKDPYGGIPGFDGVLDIRDLSYQDEIRAGRINGTLDAEPGAARAEMNLNLEDVAGFGASVVSADIDGTLTDPLGEPGFVGQVRARQARYQDYRVGQLTADIDGPPGLETLQVNATAGDVSGGGIGLARGTVDASLTGVLSGTIGASGTADLAGLRAGGGQIGRLNATFDLADLTGAPAGTVRGDAGGIDFGGISAASAQLDARLTASGGKTRIDSDLVTSKVDLGAGTFERVDIDAVVTDALGTPVLNVDVGTSPADLGAIQLDGLAVNVRGPLSRLEIGVLTEGRRVLYPGATEPLHLTTSARLNLTGALSGAITGLRIDVGDSVIGLAAPLRFDSRGGATRLSGADIIIPGGTIRGDVAIYGNGIAGDLDVSIPDPEPLAKLVEMPLDQGQIAADLVFDTRPGRASANIALRGDNLRFNGVEDAGTLTLTYQGDWNGRTLTNALDIAGPFAQPIQGRLSLPLRSTGGLVPTVPPNTPIDGTLQWEGDIGTFWPLVPLTDHVLDGPTKVDLRVSGPVSGPVVSGEVTMTNGRYENLEIGTILTNLNITTEVASASEFRVRIDAGDSGRSKVTGTISVGPNGLDAALETREAILVRRDDVTAAVSFDVTAKGPLNAPRIAGDIRINRAEVRLVSVTPPTVTSLGDVRFVGDPPPRPPSAEAGGAITLDLTVKARDDIFVRGRGLDSEWQMDLKVDGTANAPRVTGKVLKRRGQLELIGREFDLSEGEVVFNGQNPIDPRLNVRLIRDEEDVVGGIWVHGRASDIKVDFVSEPVLPDDEVLPRVLFGRSKQSLSAAEAVQLAAGVATLLNGTGGTLDQIRNAVGIDVLRVDSAGDTSAVTVGQNVADDVFVGVKQPFDGGPASVEIEIEVLDNLDINSSVGGAGSSVGVEWKKDF